MLALHEACRLLESGAQPVMGVFGAPTLHAAPVEREHAHAAGVETRRWDELLWGTWTRALREGAGGSARAGAGGGAMLREGPRGWWALATTIRWE